MLIYCLMLVLVYCETVCPIFIAIVRVYNRTRAFSINHTFNLLLHSLLYDGHFCRKQNDKKKKNIMCPIRHSFSRKTK